MILLLLLKKLIIDQKTITIDKKSKNAFKIKQRLLCINSKIINYLIKKYDHTKEHPIKM